MMVFAALVAGSFSLGRMAAPYIDPMVLNAVRFVIGAIVLWGLALTTGGVGRAVFHAPWRYFVLAGLFAIYFVTMFEGLKTAEPVSMAAVFTLNPALTAVFGYILLRQVTTPRMAIAIVIGGVGALWVIFDADLSALLRFEVGRGEAIYFFGCAAHAIYTPLVRRLNRGERPVVFSFGTMLGAAFLITAAGWGDIRATDWASLPAIVWITIVYTAVFATAMTFVCLQYASLNLPSAKVMAYTYLTPTWVTLWQAALGHPLPPVIVLMGVGLTVVALVLLLKDESLPQMKPAA